MMHGKALLFGDVTSAQRILDTDSPAHQRALGRKVEHFDNALWQRERELLVYQGNHGRFTQNQAYLEALLATAGTELVEASPRDSIWGIGLAADDSRALDRERWRGAYLLGQVLTRLRAELLAPAFPDRARVGSPTTALGSRPFDQEERRVGDVSRFRGVLEGWSGWGPDESAGLEPGPRARHQLASDGSAALGVR